MINDTISQPGQSTSNQTEIENLYKAISQSSNPEEALIFTKLCSNSPSLKLNQPSQISSIIIETLDIFNNFNALISNPAEDRIHKLNPISIYLPQNANSEFNDQFVQINISLAQAIKNCILIPKDEVPISLQDAGMSLIKLLYLSSNFIMPDEFYELSKILTDAISEFGE
jgi:hypothetical protein